MQTIPIQPEDEPFLFLVYAGARRNEVAQWGWNASQQEAFLRMQFRTQQRSYEMQFPDADHRIILLDGQRIGRIIIVRTEQEIRLADIALLPECRGNGTGTALIRELQCEAASAGKPLRLHVARANPARRLYQRLGFVITGETEMHYAMQWQAPQKPDRQG